MIRANAWTTAEANTLREMANAGRTGTEIAEALGKTRNAILGYCHRNGVRLPWTAEKKAAQVRRNRRPRKPRPEQRTGKYWKFSPEHPARSSRPFGSRAFQDQQIATAIAAHLAGLSMAKAAKMIGASHQSLSKHWLKDPALLALGTALFERAKAEAAIKAAEAHKVAEMRRAAEAHRVWTNNRPILEAMPERHRAILERRIQGETLQEIGDDYGVTRERIRQIEARWRLAGLIVPGARPLNELAARRIGKSPSKLTPAAPSYWSEKVEKAFSAIQ